MTEQNIARQNTDHDCTSQSQSEHITAELIRFLPTQQVGFVRFQDQSFRPAHLAHRGRQTPGGCRLTPGAGDPWPQMPWKEEGGGEGEQAPKVSAGIARG